MLVETTTPLEAAQYRIQSYHLLYDYRAPDIIEEVFIISNYLHERIVQASSSFHENAENYIKLKKILENFNKKIKKVVNTCGILRTLLLYAHEIIELIYQINDAELLMKSETLLELLTINYVEDVKEHGEQLYNFLLTKDDFFMELCYRKYKELYVEKCLGP